MVKWKKLNKKVAGLLLGVMVLFSASTTAFAYVDPSAEATNTEMTNAEAPQTETTQTGETPVEETDQPAEDGTLPENNMTEKKEDAFTEPGNGEVQDDIQNGSSKEFLTITTKNNNTFYLVIDRSSNSQNVYLLSQVDENDLKEFVDQEKGTATVTPTPQVVIDENKIEETDKKEEAAKTEKEKMPQTNMGAMAVILILALGGVAAYYYFKIYKPKKEEEEDFEEEGLETSDGLEIINEDEFEDREEENE